MSKDENNGFLAGRLLQWGLDPRARPSQEPEYRELIDRYLDNVFFRDHVREVARGLGMAILDVGEHGIILAPMEESIFALRAAQFRPTSSTTDTRLMDGLVQLAIAATIYPRDRDLDDDAAVARPPTTVDEIEDTMRRLCERIEEENRGKPDPVVSENESGIYEAWRVYQRHVATMATRDERRAQKTTRRIVEYGLDRLRDFGCFIKEDDGENAVYQPTYRYQVLVKELAATSAYKAVRRFTDLIDKSADSGGND